MRSFPGLIADDETTKEIEKETKNHSLSPDKHSGISMLSVSYTQTSRANPNRGLGMSRKESPSAISISLKSDEKRTRQFPEGNRSRPRMTQFIYFSEVRLYLFFSPAQHWQTSPQHPHAHTFSSCDESVSVDFLFFRCHSFPNFLLGFFFVNSKQCTYGQLHRLFHRVSFCQLPILRKWDPIRWKMKICLSFGFSSESIFLSFFIFFLHESLKEQEQPLLVRGQRFVFYWEYRVCSASWNGKVQSEMRNDPI